MGYKKLSQLQEKQLVLLYLSGVSIKALLEKYGYKTKKSIEDKVKKYGPSDAVNVARLARKLYNYHFDGITNSFNAYFLGLMFTDGYISLGNKYGIDLTDKDCIEFISNVTGKLYCTYPQEDKKTRYRVIMSDAESVKNLERYGVVKNKTFTIPYQHLTADEEKYLPYIIRGIIDGDGCVYKTSYNAPAFYICSASLQFINWIKDTLENKLFMKDLHKSKTPEGIWRIDTSLQTNIQKLIAIVYDLPYGMSRKYETIRKTFRDYNNDSLMADGIVQTATERA